MKSLVEPAITGPRSLRDPRSREYAIQTMRSLKRYLEGKSLDAQGVARELQRIKEYKHWKVFGFKSEDDYLKAEIGTTLKQLERRLAQDLAADPAVTPAASHAEAGALGGRGNKAADNVRGFGNSASYLVRRLKRDHPEIAEALARGEFRSARAAGIAAGIVKPRVRRCPKCGHEW